MIDFDEGISQYKYLKENDETPTVVGPEVEEEQIILKYYQMNEDHYTYINEFIRIQMVYIVTLIYFENVFCS